MNRLQMINDNITFQRKEFDNEQLLFYVNDRFTYEDVKDRLDKLLFWLTAEFCPQFYYMLNTIKENDGEAVGDCQNKVAKIKKEFGQISKFLNLCKSRNAKQHYKFAYLTRQNEDAYFELDKNIPIWPVLQLFDFEHLILNKLPQYSEEAITSPPSNTQHEDNQISSMNNKECRLCGLKYSPNFKFNFSVVYEDAILNVFYYLDDYQVWITDIDNMGMPTVQIKSPQLLSCLLCRKDISSNVNAMAIHQHIHGQKHSVRKSNLVAIRILGAYHKAWLKLETNYQSHQAYFLPINEIEAVCSLCQAVTKYNHLEEHIQSSSHKNNLLKIVSSRGVKLFLTDLQLSVYPDDNVELNVLSATVSQSSCCKNLADLDCSDSDTDTDSSKKTKAEKRIYDTCAKKPTKKGKDGKHNVIKSISNSSKSIISHQLEERFHAHLALIDHIDRSTLNCFCCKTNIQNDIRSIKNHILENGHSMKSGIRFIKFHYCCDVCKFRTTNEELWQDHISHSNHSDRCSSLESGHISKLTEYQCQTCNLVLFGDDSSVRRHQMIGYRCKGRDVIVLPESVKVLFKSEKSIDKEGVKFVKEANQVLLEQEGMLLCQAALERAVSESYPGCKAYLFGSRVSGLGNKESDLDVFIDTGGMYCGIKNQDAKAQEKFVKASTKLFRKRKNEFDHVNPIPNARTPIVQVYHIHSNIDCDISFRHALSVENTKFLRLCMKIQPIVQPLILILKEWSRNCKLHENITTYALAMMTVFFLQIKNYLISVHELKQLYLSELVIDGWSVPDFSQVPQSLCYQQERYEGSLKTILMDFFSYYMKFDYCTDVICPLLGRPIQKQLFTVLPVGKGLPPEMSTYADQITNNSNVDLFRLKESLCVQDPFDLSHNLTKICSQRVTEKFVKLCAISYKHLNSMF